MSISRRDVLKYAAAAPAGLGLGTGLLALAPPRADAAPLGILLDYAAGVIGAGDLRASGALGAIRYVSDRRPGGAWMLGKPIQLPEARDLYENGLKIVSCYQYGKQDTADWLGGQTAGVAHAQRAGRPQIRSFDDACCVVQQDAQRRGSGLWRRQRRRRRLQAGAQAEHCGRGGGVFEHVAPGNCHVPQNMTGVSIFTPTSPVTSASRFPNNGGRCETSGLSASRSRNPLTSCAQTVQFLR